MHGLRRANTVLICIMALRRFDIATVRIAKCVDVRFQVRLVHSELAFHETDEVRYGWLLWILKFAGLHDTYYPARS